MTVRNKTFSVLTLGCKVNQYESQMIRDQLRAHGLRESTPEKSADIIVINTCTVTESAHAKSRKLVRSSRRKYPKAYLVVTGCCAQLPRDITALKKLHPDAIVKNSEKEDFIRHVAVLRRTVRAESLSGIVDFKDHARAFVKIQDGCDNKCSYCKVGVVRPKIKSKAFARAFSECKTLIEHGFKEIVLCGICLGAYGRDLDDNASLLSLLRALESLPCDFRVRLSSLELYYVTEELLSFMRRSRIMCRHLHIPLQSGSDAVLRRMNRKYDAKEFLAAIAAAKKSVPGLSFTTDVMVGFPGETENDFAATARLLKKTAPLRTHLFPYSAREGTKAFALHDTVSAQDIHRRVKVLERLSQETTASCIKKNINHVHTVVVQKSEQSYRYFGYSGNYMKVYFDCPHSHAPGDFAGVEIVKYGPPDRAIARCVSGCKK
jgi:threonylcarbamoyladenosine tRNA methylthiotransferase MtaB